MATVRYGYNLTVLYLMVISLDFLREFVPLSKLLFKSWCFFLDKLLMQNSGSCYKDNNSSSLVF